MNIEIKPGKIIDIQQGRRKEEVNAWVHGFDAGVNLCIKAIQDNADKFKEMIMQKNGECE